MIRRSGMKTQNKPWETAGFLFPSWIYSETLRHWSLHVQACSPLVSLMWKNLSRAASKSLESTTDSSSHHGSDQFLILLRILPWCAQAREDQATTATKLARVSTTLDPVKLMERIVSWKLEESVDLLRTNLDVVLWAPRQKQQLFSYIMVPLHGYLARISLQFSRHDNLMDSFLADPAKSFHSTQSGLPQDLLLAWLSFKFSWLTSPSMRQARCSWMMVHYLLKGIHWSSSVKVTTAFSGSSRLGKKHVSFNPAKGTVLLHSLEPRVLGSKYPSSRKILRSWPAVSTLVSLSPVTAKGGIFEPTLPIR